MLEEDNEKERKGKLIVLEGTDGAGKATQADLLIRKFESQGFKTGFLDFPQYGKNVFADTVSAYLRSEFGEAVELNPYLSSLAYSADRWKASLEFKKDLEEGKIIISNRYTSASMGHQGSKFSDKEELRKYISWLKEIEFGESGFGIPEPDATVLLYLKPEIAQKMVEKKRERIYLQGKKLDAHESNIEHLQKSAETFLQVAKNEGWKIIDCTDYEKNEILPAEKIHDKIWDEVRGILEEREQ